MNGHEVKRLEAVIRQVIADRADELPRDTSPRTIELMAKAAVTVLEAVDESTARAV